MLNGKKIMTIRWILYKHVEWEDDPTQTDICICGCWSTNLELKNYIEHLKNTEPNFRDCDYEILEVKDNTPTNVYAKIYIIETFLRKNK